MDISLPYSMLSENGLNVFQTVIINEKFAAVLGVSDTENVEIGHGFISRLPENLCSAITLSQPKFVKTIDELFIHILSHVNSTLAPLLTSSILYRMQGNHIVLGGVECIKSLGLNLQVHFQRIVCQNQSFDYPSQGTELKRPFESFSVKQEAPDEKSDGASSGKATANITCSVSNTISKLGAFKVVPSTRLHITYGYHGRTDTSPTIPSKPTQQARSAGLSQRLFGLDTIQMTLLSYIRDFSTGVQHFADIDDCSDVVQGILIYGLAGCGKRRLLHQLSLTQSDEQPWLSNIKFLTVTLALVNSWSSDRTNPAENPVMVWLKGECYSSEGDEAVGIVLLLPDLDNWLMTSAPGEVGDFNTEAEGTGLTKSLADGGQSHPLGKLLEAINILSYEASAVGRRIMWCMIATATTAEDVFCLPECRQLFHRRLLVPLPDARTRYSILQYQIASRLSALATGLSGSDSNNLLNALNDSHVDECLVQVAAKLHGYSPRDLHCLLKLSFSALLSKTNDASAPDLIDLCKLIGRFSVAYLQGNLAHQLTPVEPLMWTDIGGYTQLKRLFQRVVQRRLLHASDPDGLESRADAALGLRVPRGILLHGPPGCSKTMFVRALATECQLPLVVVQASRIFGRYVGDSERNMRRVLVQARASAPAILFIDEIDLLLPSRSSSETGASEHVLGEVLTAMDGVEGQSGQLILIAATNRLEKLDTALSRAGRFDLVVEVPPPDSAARIAIVGLELSHRATDPQDDPACSDWLADFADRQLIGYTGAEVVQVVQYAAQLARDSNSHGIGRRHLTEARSLCPPRSLATTSPEDLPDEMDVSGGLLTGCRCHLLLALTLILIAYFVSRLYPYNLPG